jgi:hypothetical protein
MRWLLFFVGLMVALAAGAADIYRWTDDNGQVHYGQRPPTQGAKRLDMPSTEAPPGVTDAAAAERRARQKRLLDAYTYEREQDEAERKREDERARQLVQECQRLQRYWRRLAYAGPVYLKGDGGERRYLDDEQRAAEMERLRPAYRQACGKGP